MPQLTGVSALQQNKSHGFEAMHLKEQIFAITIKNITLVVFSEFVLKVEDSG